MTELLATANAHVATNQALGPSWLDPETMLDKFGDAALPMLCLIIFAECGLLIGFFLPGDTLLFIAGLFVADDKIDAPIWLICLLLSVCALIGNMCGYYIGYKAGPAIFNKPDSRLFKKEYVDKTHEFFEKYGARAVVMARFVPIVRTFITVTAGVARMDQRTYFTYSAIGGVVWAAGVTLLGYWLGQFDFVKTNVELMILLIVALSALPIVIEFRRARREGRREASDSEQVP